MNNIQFPFELAYRRGKIHVLCDDGLLRPVQDFIHDKALVRLFNDIFHEIYRQDQVAGFQEK